MLRYTARRAEAISAAAQARLADNVLDLIATVSLSDLERVPAIAAEMALVPVRFSIETFLGEDLSAAQFRLYAGSRLGIRAA
jgi:hypothetical protein